MKDQEILELLKSVTEPISDRNSCLTQLANSRAELMRGLTKMGFNHGNDINGAKEKWAEMKEQAEKIDQLIRDLSK